MNRQVLRGDRSPDAGHRQVSAARSGPDQAGDWRPSAPFEAMRFRAAMNGRIRDYFAAAGVLEVETPILSGATVTDPVLASLATAGRGPGLAGPLFLQTSPEFAMKRLLAAGSGPIYQICKVFRDDERGRFHHPEFTLLEWYRPGWDHRQLMTEVAELVRLALGRPDLPAEYIGYRELFLSRLGLDPWCASPDDLRQVACDVGIADAGQLDLSPDGWLDLLLSHRLAPDLGRGGMTFLFDYPPSQAALARVRPGAHPAAERFELYLDGVELANGFHELTDAVEQERRFDADLAERRRQGLPTPPRDDRLLAALAAGLPACAGVALGLDRLLMSGCGAGHIDEVLAFPVERA